MVVYFCIVDLIAIHANNSMPLQITVFVLTLLALIILWSLFIRASRSASKEARLKRDRGESSEMYNDLNGLERALLCPLLALMWPIKKLMALGRSKRTPRSSNSSSSATKIQPRQKSEIEMVSEKAKRLEHLSRQLSQQMSGSEKTTEEEDWDAQLYNSDNDWDDEEYDPTTF